MSTPISPPPVTESGRDELPAYVSNGLVGIRLIDIPLLPGVVLISGYTGLHPVVQVEAAAQAPYPIGGDIGLNHVWLRSTPQQAEFVEQRYDFSVGELHTRFRYSAGGATALVDVLTFCSQKQPTIILQEVAIEVDQDCDLAVRAIVDISGVQGRVARRTLKSPGKPDTTIDGSIAWESLGGKCKCGIAYATEFLGDGEVEPRQLDWGLENGLGSEVNLRARSGRRYRLRQVASVVPSTLHSDPDRAATRLVARAADTGFDALREENRVEWNEHWKGRPLIDADDDRWQQLADAAFFYLNTSVHPSAPSSTSIYGLAQWNDYHYYYGHVMWDIETFCVPPLLFCQPDAARTILEFRTQTIRAARANAKMNGRRGLQFPWEAGPLHGDEASPGEGRASWHEDHVSADVAWAFAQYAHATGDERFLREDGAPILYGVADWITSRVSRTRSGFTITKSMGIAEKKQTSDNEAFTIMSAKVVLREAIACAERLGHSVLPAWREVLKGLEPPRSSSGGLTSHAAFHPNEEKGSTPGPLAGLFPLWYDVEPDVARKTIDYYLKLAPDYIGSPMLSPLYGVWAAWNGDRARSRRLLEEGYGALMGDRYLQTLEQSPEKFPDKPKSGPFFANLGGFLSSLYFGFPGIRLGPGETDTWPARPVVLPAGWRSIEVEQAWVRMEPARIVATHGAERAIIDVAGKRRRRAA
ncbi:MAG: glycoside hydrolase family 65 protein [Chloroflexota bacterium]